uniref:Uncharacterized protein n=1 Tax=Anguilla anguilla TaxID=7936 RepID=A0A0E9V2B0_ANGAN
MLYGMITPRLQSHDRLLNCLVGSLGHKVSHTFPLGW